MRVGERERVRVGERERERARERESESESESENGDRTTSSGLRFIWFFGTCLTAVCGEQRLEQNYVVWDETGGGYIETYSLPKKGHKPIE